MKLIDPFNRKIDYLRVSVTDRCNFRCIYCMPEDGITVAPRESILTYEEIERIVGVAASLGMYRIRITGGEPLVRRDIVELVQKVAATPGIQETTLTTNGMLLAQYAQDLAQAGLQRVNVSLDTLQPDRFQRIARRGNLEAVLSGIDAAYKAGLRPLKLNMVVMRNINDDEITDFAELVRRHPYDIRYIEMMPINWSDGEVSPFLTDGLLKRNGSQASPYPNSNAPTIRLLCKQPESNPPLGMLDAAQLRRLFVPAKEIRERIESRYGLLTSATIRTNGPARSFRYAGAAGTISFISQITNDNCLECNRLRLTADGFLRPCLMANGEVNLREPLRSGATDEELADLFRTVVFHKPKEHYVEEGMLPVGRNMNQIGG